MKTIALSLSFLVIIICGTLIVNYVKYLDIASNKTDWYVMDRKRKINQRTDISLEEKKALKNNIDIGRNSQKERSNFAFQCQVFALAIIIIQLALMLCIFLIKSKPQIQPIPTK